MVLKARLALLLASLLLFLVTGCVWLDEEAPTGARIPAGSAIARPSPPDYLDSLPGVGLIPPGEISTFLGGSAFRLVLTVRAEQPLSAVNLFVLESGPDVSPRLARYPMVGAAGGIYGVLLHGFDLAPDGMAVAYSASSIHQTASRPGTPWMQTLGSNPWLVPLAGATNASNGMIGEGAFWHMQDGKPAIGFTGLAYGSDFPQSLQVADTRFVVPLSDNTISPVEVFRHNGQPIKQEIIGVTRDGNWVLLIKDGVKRLCPAAWLLDTASLGNSDTLRHMTAGSSADLNPFEPTSTSHMDYYTTLPFIIPDSVNALAPDTALTPRFLDGTSGLYANPNSIWICDRDRNIILSQALPQGFSNHPSWVRWTEHPNFLLASMGGSLYLMRLGPDSKALLEGTETRTLNAHGILRIATDGASILSAGLWIGG